MSKNKIRHTEHVSQSVPVMKILLGLLLIGGLIWGLVALFQPSADMVPYSKFKKTDVSVATPEETAPKSKTKPASSPVEEEKKEPLEQLALNDPDKNAGFHKGYFQSNGSTTQAAD